MYNGKTVFAQLMDHLPWYQFHRCVKRYNGNYKVKRLKCSDYFRVMAFAQLTYRESLRDIESCLRAMQSRLYHMGIRSAVSRNNLSNAGEQRNWKMFADFGQFLIHKAQRLYAEEDFGVELDASVYALDSTSIDLCLSMFPWARFKQSKGAVKMHTVMNLRGSIPDFIHISDGKMHDVHLLDLLIPAPGTYYIMDRGYIDFKRLYQIHQLKGLFVIRAQNNQGLRRRYSHPIDRSSGLVCDQTVVLSTPSSAKDYREVLRRIKFNDPNRQQTLVVLTNDFELPAWIITQLYKARWQIELFFKWIKQHLRIKSFYGTSLNAVKAQIWIAISSYLLIAILKKQLSIKLPLYTILQILSLTIFEKRPLLQVLDQGEIQIENTPLSNQLIFRY